jgi:diguanylate cyclase (GGDEF)-like protein
VGRHITPRSGRRPTVRPVLLILVLGAFLLIIGATATGQAALVSADSSTVLLNATVSADAATVRSFVGLNLSPADLQPGGLSSERQANLRHALQLLIDRGGILRAALLAPDGTVLASDDGSSVGSQAPLTSGLANAVQNAHADAAIVDLDAAGALASLDTNSVLREYLPITDNGRVYATVAVWRDAAPILSQLAEGRIRVVAITLIGGLITLCLMFFIFRGAQQRLTRQTQQLLEAAGKDPLTGAPNHGALVEQLEAQIEVSRQVGGPGKEIGVALIDLDSFSLLDSTYGHRSGDHVLVEIVRLLAEWMPPGATWGRYGPDEFLVITATGRASDLQPAIASLQATLDGTSIQFEGSERLPVTFSAGISYYPTNGDSVTRLLSVTAMTLEEAKASGGDFVRVAEARAPEPAFLKTFTILEGLVKAVDTKDRYTRRHSDDVARYADFLAHRLDLDAVTRRAIQNAGKLHDIGKIGIPDAILRKPGRLAAEEFAILRQHVTFGDAIVKDLPDLPDLDLIRAGIRYHHERWDGKGYVEGLAGEAIPLVARILAVADAFSAITTTRPYRKSMSAEEALARIEEAAGTQLDPELAKVFVQAMRGSMDAPRPVNQDKREDARELTIPGRQVA